MTLDEWAALDEDDTAEWADGARVEAEVPSYVHELVVAWLVRVLGNWGVPRGAFVATSGGKFAVSRRRGRMPDVTVFLPGTPRPAARGLIETPPSIAIEVITPTPRDERRDRVEKLLEYAAFGVAYYWIVDPELRTFEVLELRDGHYVHLVAVTEGVVDQVPGCTELTVDVGALWAEIERFESTP